jgi:hypothetical protein
MNGLRQRKTLVLLELALRIPATAVDDDECRRRDAGDRPRVLARVGNWGQRGEFAKSYSFANKPLLKSFVNKCRHHEE